MAVMLGLYLHTWYGGLSFLLFLLCSYIGVMCVFCPNGRRMLSKENPRSKATKKRSLRESRVEYTIVKHPCTVCGTVYKILRFVVI